MLKNIVIVALIVVNGTLIYAFVTRTPPSSTTALQLSSVEATQQQAPATPAPAYKATAETHQPQEPIADQGYEELADVLRQRGVTEDLIRQMVLASFDSDYLALQQQNKLDTPYWKKPQQDPYQQVISRLEFEESKRTMLIRVFGEQIVDDPFFEDLFKPMNESLGFLSTDKQIALDNLVRSNRGINSAARSDGFIRETREELRANSQDLTRAIQELLSEEEYFEYLLRESPLANNLVRTMDGLDYSEQEFRDIYEIRSTFDVNEIRQAGGGRTEFAEAREDNNEQIRNYLGENRYAEYERLQDPAFRSLLSIGERYGTSDTDLVAVYEITSTTRQQMQAVANTKGMSRQETRRRINELESEAHAEIEQIVGEDVAASVRQNTSRYSRRR
jgi:hypothetical protein